MRTLTHLLPFLSIISGKEKPLLEDQLWQGVTEPDSKEVLRY